MDHYEEFGVTRDASQEEIRRAYKNLVRLLHPDQQTDECLRRLAGVQMARLNDVVQTLTDPTLRSQYDDSLRTARDEAAPGEHGRGFRNSQFLPDLVQLAASWRRPWSAFIWLGAGILGSGMIALFLAQGGSAERGPVAADLTVPQPASFAGATPSSSAVRFGKRRQADGLVSSPYSPSDLAASSPDIPKGSHPASRYGLRSHAESGTDGLVGEWFYPEPPTLADDPSVCPPLYIALQISESNGELRGHYSAKYTVGDRPISPFVFFDFAGAAHGLKADLPWNGSGGSAGRVRLTLTSARSLRVDWNASQQGNKLGLISGTATLLRQQAP